MKTKLTLTLMLLLGLFTFAQNGINYKAVIKDGSGNVVANDLIVIEFEIEDESVVLYRESHTPTTDDNGLIVVTIGEGTTIVGDFTDIEWGADNHYLNVYVNTGGGLTSMGTSQFKYVPYAKNADIAKTLENPVWIRNVNNRISYTDGNVGVGITNPVNTFSVLQPTGTSNTARIESLEHPTGKDLLELIVPSGSDAGSQFIEMQNGSSIVAQINGDGSARFKSVQFEDFTTQTTAAKGPIAHGSILSGATIGSGSGNYSVIWVAASSRYEITIAGEDYNFSLYTTMVTPATSSIRAVRTSSSGGRLLVYLYNSAGTAVQGNFHFLTFK